MCDNLYDLRLLENKNPDLFICRECARILLKMIREKIDYTIENFDKIRGIKNEN